ncbi:MAG TPA: hypothetical protein VHE30_01895 [Polyangiaceae bacterium]|nr:hypothetical protein [Polyangiaceae bacterium]
MRLGRIHRFGPLAVALVALFVFSPSLVGGFVFDDLPLIRDNPWAHELRFVRGYFGTALWDAHARGEVVLGLGYYRPLVFLTYVLNWVWGGGRPWVFHATNVLAHALTVLLATRVLLRWVPDARVALGCSLLFAIHPTRGESVLWISGRTDVFALLFQLACLELSRAGGSARGLHRAAAWGAASLAALAAFLCKESSAGLPLFFLVDSWCDAPPARRGESRAPLVAATVASAIYLGLRWAWMPVFLSTPSFSLPGGFVSIWAETRRVIFPWPGTFFPDPLEFVNGAPHWPAARVVGGALVGVGYVALSVRAYRRDRAAAAALVAAALLVLPLLQFVATGVPNTAADRFLYEPLFFLVAALGRALEARPPWARTRSAVLAFAGVLLASAGAVLVRTVDFQSDVAIWRAELRANPENPLALRELGRDAAHSGDLAAAERLLARAVSPGSMRFGQLATPWFALGVHVHRLELYARQTADGDVVRLEAALGELRRLWAGDPPESPPPAPDLPRRAPIGPKTLATFRRDRSRVELLSSAGVLAARLGRDEIAREMLSAVPTDSARLVPNALRVALAWAEVGDAARARAFASSAGLGGEAAPLLDSASRLSASTSERERVATATTLANLGAYLRALRVLRPVLEAGASVETARLYVQLLVFSRLDREARAVASRFTGEDAGAIVQALRAALPAPLRGLRPVREPSPWWPPAAAR